MSVKKVLYVILGCIGVGLGAVGAVLPLLPSFPFLLLAAFCFARSSERLNDWFINTRLYKENLESYVQGKGMTRKAKVKIMVTVTGALALSLGSVLLDILEGAQPVEEPGYSKRVSGFQFVEKVHF